MIFHFGSFVKLLVFIKNVCKLISDHKMECFERNEYNSEHIIRHCRHFCQNYVIKSCEKNISILKQFAFSSQDFNSDIVILSESYHVCYLKNGVLLLCYFYDVLQRIYMDHNTLFSTSQRTYFTLDAKGWLASNE